MGKELNKQPNPPPDHYDFGHLVRSTFDLEFSPESLSEDQRDYAEISKRILSDLRQNNLLSPKQERALDTIGQLVSYDEDVEKTDFDLDKLILNSR